MLKEYTFMLSGIYIRGCRERGGISVSVMVM